MGDIYSGARYRGNEICKLDRGIFDDPWDGGIYRCRVTFRKLRSSWHTKMYREDGRDVRSVLILNCDAAEPSGSY